METINDQIDFFEKDFLWNNRTGKEIAELISAKARTDFTSQENLEKIITHFWENKKIDEQTRRSLMSMLNN